jgi:hypothetical protein
MLQEMLKTGSAKADMIRAASAAPLMATDRRDLNERLPGRSCP